MNQLTFREAIERTPDVANGFRGGLAAFGQYAGKIRVPDSRLIDGSLDIDASTADKYPQENRWDYALSYHNEVFYIEIHPAISSEVSKMIKKLTWLKGWLTMHAPEIKKLTAMSKNPYYWVQSSNCSIPKHTSQYKAAVQHKILPIPIWDFSRIK